MDHAIQTLADLRNHQVLEQLMGRAEILTRLHDNN